MASNTAKVVFNKSQKWMYKAHVGMYISEYFQKILAGEKLQQYQKIWIKINQKSRISFKTWTLKR